MREYIVEHKDGSFRAATPKEVDCTLMQREYLNEINSKIEELTKERDALMSECQHEVRFDEFGWPYDNRYCAVCGLLMDLI